MKFTSKQRCLTTLIVSGLFALIFASDIRAGVLATLSATGHSGQKRGGPTNVVFDTDMWSDLDDALALAMLHALHDRNEINLLAVTISTDEQWCAPYVDLVNRFYGHAQIPIGVVREGMNTEAFRKLFPDSTWPGTRYTEHFAQREKKKGRSDSLHDGTDVPEAVALLRRTLSEQPDRSVVMIQVGYSTNYARLLESKPDRQSTLSGLQLVAKKVRLLSTMAGNFGDSTLNGKVLPKGSPEFNLRADIKSAQKLFANWPTPIVASGFEVGLKMLYPHESIEHDFEYVEKHPIAETYRFVCEENQADARPKANCPHDHATFDLTSVLYAARPDRNYFALSEPGRITILDDGRSTFEPVEGGRDRYLILREDQKARTLEAMVMLVSQPPALSTRP